MTEHLSARPGLPSLALPSLLETQENTATSHQVATPHSSLQLLVREARPWEEASDQSSELTTWIWADSVTKSGGPNTRFQLQTTVMQSSQGRVNSQITLPGSFSNFLLYERPHVKMSLHKVSDLMLHHLTSSTVPMLWSNKRNSKLVDKLSVSSECQISFLMNMFFGHIIKVKYEPILDCTNKESQLLWLETISKSSSDIKKYDFYKEQKNINISASLFPECNSPQRKEFLCKNQLHN